MAYLEQKKVLALPEFDEQLRGVTFSPSIAWQNRLNKGMISNWGN